MPPDVTKQINDSRKEFQLHNKFEYGYDSQGGARANPPLDADSPTKIKECLEQSAAGHAQREEFKEHIERQNFTIQHDKELARMRMHGNPRAIVAEQRAMRMRAVHDEQRAMHDAHLEYHETKRVLKKEVRELKTNIKLLKTLADNTEEEEEALKLQAEARKLKGLDLAGVEASLAEVAAEVVLLKRDREIEALKKQLEGKKGDLRIVATAIKVIKVELS